MQTLHEVQGRRDAAQAAVYEAVQRDGAAWDVRLRLVAAQRAVLDLRHAVADARAWCDLKRGKVHGLLGRSDATVAAEPSRWGAALGVSGAGAERLQARRAELEAQRAALEADRRALNDARASLAQARPAEVAPLLGHLRQTLVSVHRRQRTFAVALRALFDLRPVGENEQAIAILGYVFPRSGDLQGARQ